VNLISQPIKNLDFRLLLLIEGPTEVKTIQQFLRMLSIEQHVLMIPLEADSMINGSREDELRELKRITTNIVAVIDSERIKENGDLPNNRAAFKESCKSVGIKCHVTDRPSIENYFPAEAITKVYGKAHTALGAFELIKNRPDWPKTDNWRIARNEMEDLAKTDLGGFFDSLKQSVDAR
jgi:hypothetical protein